MPNQILEVCHTYVATRLLVLNDPLRVAVEDIPLGKNSKEQTRNGFHWFSLNSKKMFLSRNSVCRGLVNSKTRNGRERIELCEKMFFFLSHRSVFSLFLDTPTVFPFV